MASVLPCNSEKWVRIKPDGSGFTVAAGTSDVTSDVIDTQGYEGVEVLTGFGAITSSAVTSVKLTQCDTSGGTYADLAGTSIAVADDDDNQMTHHVLFRPLERYIKVVTDRGTANAVIDFQLVKLFGAKKQPTTDDTATVVSREIYVSPAEGTA